MSKILGIDLGTGFSAMAVMENGSAKIITNAEGERTTPSIVAWNKNGERLVGSPAKRQAVNNPQNTVYEVKRFIGRKYDEAIEDIKLVSYKVEKADNGDCRISANGRLYSPEEISSFVLAKLKADAEAYLGETITDAIITCPAYFNDSQRQATKAAGTIAGLNVLRIINEPTAAALAYGVDKDKSGYIAVADAGSGTLDFSILEIGDGVFEVKSTAGDSQLGGKDYDQALMNWLISEFKSETGIDLGLDPMALQRVKDESEKAKIALSSTESYDINLPFITMDATGPKHLMRNITRSKFEQLVEHLNDRYDKPARQCISDADVGKIDEVILVGGTTRIPSVQRKIQSIFNLDPSKGVNPDEVVAMGAAIQGGVINGQVTDVLLLDVTPLTLSIETMGKIATPMIDRNTTIPVKKSQVFSTASDNQTAVTIRVCQGERKLFGDNKVLGTFNLEGIAPAPRGIPQIEVTFDINANGILTVTAVDKATNKQQHISITNASGLSKDEIEKAKAEAEAHAEEDKKRAEEIEAVNHGESIAYQAEKFVKEVDSRLTAEQKSEVEAKVKVLNEAVAARNVEEINKAVEGVSATLGNIQQNLAGPAVEDIINNAAKASDTPDDVVDVEAEPVE